MFDTVLYCFPYMNQRSICAMILNNKDNYIKFANAYVIALNKNIVNWFYTYHYTTNIVFDYRIIEINNKNLVLNTENFYNCLQYLYMFPHKSDLYKLNSDLIAYTSKIDSIPKASIIELFKKIILFEIKKYNKINNCIHNLFVNDEDELILNLNIENKYDFIKIKHLFSPEFNYIFITKNNNIISIRFDTGTKNYKCVVKCLKIINNLIILK